MTNGLFFRGSASFLLFNKKKTKQCENNAIKKIYKDNNMEELYNKSKECDKIIFGS